MKKYLSLLAWIIALEGIAFLLGKITQFNLVPWYENLIKSPLTPPGWIFSITWTLLYCLIATAGWLIFRLESKKSQVLFMAQLVLNWSWTPLFFQAHFIGLSLLCLLGILALTGCLIFETFHSNRSITFLLLPYLLWSLFACFLNWFIWVYN